MSNEKRMPPKKRTTQMLEIALKLAEKIGMESLTRENVAQACNLSPAMINVRFGTMTQMRRDIMRAAVRCESLGVIAYGVATKHPAVKGIKPELRAKALDHVAAR